MKWRVEVAVVVVVVVARGSSPDTLVPLASSHAADAISHQGHKSATLILRGVKRVAVSVLDTRRAVRCKTIVNNRGHIRMKKAHAPDFQRCLRLL